MSTIQSVSFFAITPLYGFLCDTDDLQVSDNFRLLKYEPRLVLPFEMGDFFLKSSSLLSPSHLLVEQPEIPRAQEEMLVDQEHLEDFLENAFFLPSTNFFRSLRLFRSGRLRGGETFVISSQPFNEREQWSSLASQSCSRTTIHHRGTPFAKDASFYLKAVDVPVLAAFQKRLRPILSAMVADPMPSIELAFDLYAREESEHENVVNSCTALEALLVCGSASELTYRLAMRIAHLLGEDPETRKHIFRIVKWFYDLRSKVVHGGQLKPTNINALQHVDDLREIVRRTLISVIALLAEGNDRAELEHLFDEIALDDPKRLEIHDITSSFINVERPLSGKIH